MVQTAELRMSGIGGSDAATIMGLNPCKTPLQLARDVAEALGENSPAEKAKGEIA